MARLSENDHDSKSQVLGYWPDAWAKHEARCESPIEVAMLWALAARASEHAEGVIDPEYEGCWRVNGGHWWALVGEQSRVEAGGSSYRLDFEVMLYRGDARLWNPTAKIAVECDGHDFHERTKEQAKRDRKRDRDLQGAGWLVLRFTGSEIYNSPLTCAETVWANAHRLGDPESWPRLQHLWAHLVGGK